LSNVNEKLSFVSMAPERKRPVSPTTVCGSSSWFVHVTVEPAGTVRVLGENMKFFATTIVADALSAAEAFQGALQVSTARLAAASMRRNRDEITVSSC
jgi:hypothetical protein